MTARTAAWLTGLILALGPVLHAAPVPAGDSAGTFKPTLTVRIQAPDQLLADIRYVTTLIARLAPTEKDAKEFASAVDSALEQYLGTDWRTAVDSSRPLLGYATLDANLPASTAVVLTPVKDEAAFRKLLTNLVGKLDDANGTLRFALPGARSPDDKPVIGYARFAQHYAYLTVNDPEVIAPNRMPTPAQVVAGDAAAAFSAKLVLDRVPEQFRQMAVNGVQQFKAMVRGENRREGFGISPAEVLILSGPFVQLYPLAEPAVQDGRELTLNMRFDRKRLNLAYEATLTARPGTELAKLVGAMKPQSSLFPQMIGADSAARGLIRATVPDDLRTLLLPKFEEVIRRGPSELPTWGSLVGKISESLMPTLREGEIDVAAALRGPGKADRYGIVAGVRVKDAAGVEKAVREAVKALPMDVKDTIKLDAATVGGTKVLQIKLPPLNDQAKAIFGESPIHVAFRPDAVLAAFGEGSLEALQVGLAARPQPSGQYMLEVSGRKLVPLVTTVDAEAGKKFKTFLGDEIDRVPIVEMAVEGGSTLTVRYGNGLASLAPVWFFARAVAAPAAAPVAVPAPRIQRAVPRQAIPDPR